MRKFNVFLALAIVVSTLFGAFPSMAAQGADCTVLRGSKVLTVPDGTVDSDTGLTCTSGKWQTQDLAADVYKFTPVYPSVDADGKLLKDADDTYASWVQTDSDEAPIPNGLTRVVKTANFQKVIKILGIKPKIGVTNIGTAWNFFTYVACDRQPKSGEVSWVMPLMLWIQPMSEPLSCKVVVQRDLDGSKEWQDRGYSADPYDVSLLSKDNTRLGWFIGGKGQAQIGLGSPFLLDIELCHALNGCKAPTTLKKAGGGILTGQEWSAQKSGQKFNKTAMVVVPFWRNDPTAQAFYFVVQPGSHMYVWEGVANPSNGETEPTEWAQG